MRGMIGTLAIGAVLAAGTVTGAMAQGVNNTGYSRDYYNYPNHSRYYNNPGYTGYYGYGDRGYGTGPVEGAANLVGGAVNAAGNIAGSAVRAAGNTVGAVLPPYGDRYDYYGNNYGYGSSYAPGWSAGNRGHGNMYGPGSGSGGAVAYDRGYNRGYWDGYRGR